MSYGLTHENVVAEIPPPRLTYLPRDPVNKLGIGIIGCGGISEYHCAAYQRAGYPVRLLCDHTRQKAETRARLFPSARVVDDWRDLLASPEVQVVDITTHPRERAALIREAIDAGKHVLSQKPFVLDLGLGEELVRRAEARGVCLAVNQNGRWAPHLAFMTAAVRHGLIGKISSVAFLLHFDHSWTAGTRFDDDANLLLFDFGIHWIDLVHRLFQPRTAQRVYARVTRSGAQTPKPPLVGEVICEFERGLASISFNGDTRFGQRDETTIVGANGSLSSRGPNLSNQTVELVARDGTCRVPLEGTWFENGFHGAMAELQSAVAEHRQPEHSASDNLETLKLAFAIVESARRAEPIVPGTIRCL